MSKTIWNSINIRIPDEMVFIGKNGKITIKPPLTKKGAISKKNKMPAIKLITANIPAPEIVSSGDKHNISDVTTKPKRLKVVKINSDIQDKQTNDKPKRRGMSKEEFLLKVRSKLKTNKIKEPEIEEREQIESNDIINIEPIRKKKKLTRKMRERRENRRMMRNNDINIL